MKSTAKKIRAAKAYGEVGPDEYLRLLEDATVPVDEEKLRKFREDYELGMGPDGGFSVSYGGSCYTCGLSFSYKYEAQVSTADDPPPTTTVPAKKAKRNGRAA